MARRGESSRFSWSLTAVVVLLIALVGLARLWTSWLWFSQLGFPEVFRTRLATRVLLFVVFGALMSAAVAGNLALVQRLRPPFAAASVRGRSARRASIAGPAAVLGAMAGFSASAQADTFLAWRNATPFGTTDPWFGKDAGFFVFDYPWWRHVISQLLWATGASLVASAISHWTIGALSQVQVRPGPGGTLRVVRTGHGGTGDSARRHLSILGALWLVVWALSTWFDRYGYAVASNNLFTGVGWTDFHTRIAAKNVMALVSLVCALAVVASSRTKRLPSPRTILVLLLASTLVVNGIVPAVVQRFQVTPREPSREAPFIAANIAATRAAYGIEKVKITDYDATTTVSPGQLKADAEALPGIRLIDPGLMGPAFEQLQQVKGYYSFPGQLDVDRYTLDGQFTDAVVAAREIDLNQVPDRSWNNLHTFYTHGFGMVAAYGNRRQPSGEPEWIAQQIPTVGKLEEKQSRIYFGELSTTWSVVGAPDGAEPVELDTPGGGEGGNEARTTYDGKGGVAIGNPLVRALFALRFGDINLLLSNRVNSESRVLFDRTPLERVRKVAPWLTPDADCYPAVVDGRIVWIVDGYTTSATYPNSNLLALDKPVNYVRNAVKATVDAYDGTVTLYAWDEADPVLRTWTKAYPGLVQPRSAIPQEALAHMRYPSDLFQLQREVLGRYHTTDPGTWYQKSDLWEVPNDPVKKDGKKEPPNYLSIKWPGDKAPVFSQTAVFVPKDRENLAAYLAVNADAASPDYGQMRVLKLSDKQQIAGPGQTYNAMMANEQVAVRLRNYVQGSAAASYGTLLTIPVGGGLLYVEPIYTQQQSTTGGYPVLRFVVVRFGEHIGIGDTLQQALDMVFQGDAGAATGEQATPAEQQPKQAPTGAAAAQKLLDEAAQAFTAADEALKKGDLAGYQAQLKQARAKVAAAQKALR